MPRKVTNDPSAVRDAFRKAAQAGKIGPTQANALIDKVRAGKLTESEASAFKAEAARYKSSFTPEAEKTIEDFIAHKMRQVEVLDPGPHPDPVDDKDPAVLKADKNRLEQQLVKGGELFKNGVSGKDPEQNYIGDCYLMASMSAIAKEQPELIKKAFKKNDDGTYTVTLYDQKGSKLVPREVTIDADLPRNGWYGYYYARSHDPKELWPALLEKAFAARAGSYGKIEAGVPGEAMAAITGKPSTDIDLRGMGVTPESVYAALEAATKDHKPATAATLGESSNAKYTNTGIYADHTYTVWGVSTEGGKQYVHLRNPWGESEPKGNGRDDGVFKLELSRFMDLFSGVSING